MDRFFYRFAIIESVFNILDNITIKTGINNKLPEYISLLQSEEYVMNDVLEEYGNLSASELNELYLLKTLKEVFTKENKVNILSPNLIKEVFNYTYYLKRY